ncbi:MAG: hypothetical protein LQ351_004905 [Letrouitia transgressa]|nr:MAG: hypothetical protein LQ351_004905 [Letrouitia transgressa]
MKDFSASLGNNNGTVLNLSQQSPVSTQPRALSQDDNSLKTEHGLSEQAVHGTGTGTGPGRLVANGGRCRYLPIGTLSSMSEEVAELQDILGAASEEEDERAAYSNSMTLPYDASPFSSQGFILGQIGMATNLKALSPPSNQSILLWGIYKDNVDPLVKVVHCPTVQRELFDTAYSSSRSSRARDALKFAIYFAAVVSLDHVRCGSLFGCSKEALVGRFRHGAQQALAQAGFLNSSSLVVLQAFVIFATCLRSQDDAGFVSALSSLAIHIAQSLGVLRDGTHFGLSPFETEMRRRLWWNILFLGIRSSEDYGTDPRSLDRFSDTCMPTNCNDSDMYPEMKVFPEQRAAYTEMTWCLTQCELVQTNRDLNSLTSQCADAEEALYTKRRLIDQCRQKLREGYFRYCDKSNPIVWLMENRSHLVLTKMCLLAHHVYSIREKKTMDPQTKETLFLKSIEVIDGSHALRQNEKTAQWTWLFPAFVQWYAFIFVLSELCTRQPGPECDAAWKAVKWIRNDRVLQDPNIPKGIFWEAVRHLLAKAEARMENPALHAHTGSVEGHSPQPQPYPASSEIGRCGLGQGQPPFVYPMSPQSPYYHGNPNTMSGDTSSESMTLSHLSEFTLSQPGWSDNAVQTWLVNEGMRQYNLELIDWSGFNTGMTQEQQPWDAPSWCNSH